MTVLLGNASAVRLVVNGRELPFEGPAGPFEFTLPDEISLIST